MLPACYRDAACYRLVTGDAACYRLVTARLPSRSHSQSLLRYDEAQATLGSMTPALDGYAAIRRAFPPPAVDVDWRVLERELCLQLPSSYKALCDAYGDSVIGERGHVRIELIAPQAKRATNRFPAAALAVNASLRKQRAESSPVYPGPVPELRDWRFYPEEGGLLPWARDSLELIFFHMYPSSDPDGWPIVAPRVDGNLEVVPETDAASFLARLLTVRSASCASDAAAGTSNATT